MKDTIILLIKCKLIVKKILVKQLLYKHIVITLTTKLQDFVCDLIIYYVNFHTYINGAGGLKYNLTILVHLIKIIITNHNCHKKCMNHLGKFHFTLGTLEC